MTPSEDTTEESIFEEALSLASHAEREAFLSKACDGRPELLISVKSLLAAYSDGEILERTLLPVAVTHLLHTADLSGIKIGPYLLRQLIGHGGMGAVYLAEQQQPIQRKVALKIVRPERCSHDALRRFQVEQQSLARLDHPYIAQVLDASVTNTGISYFAMELVDGLPILACCEKHSLSIPDRLRLIVQCCQAIQHAHQRNIIHRDIKPSNVLVTLHEGSWFVKVIDFGIAKAFSETESQDLNSTSNTATQFGVFLGTPLYMSPEQASMGSVAIDPRADIYSLGALLYSVLTGLPPYDPGRFRNLRLDEVRLIISDEDPVLPSARVRHKISSSDSTSTDVSENRRLALQLSGDLDCVVMKAMQKDRDQRYQTVAELIEDLQRVLDHRPVKARAPTLIYRLTRFARRNRRGLVNIGIAAACLSVALTVAIIQSRRVSLAEQRTLAERAQKDRAENERIQSQYAADLRLALSATLSNDPGAATTILNKYVPANGATDQRSFDWYFLAGRNTVTTSELLKAEKSLYYLCRINQGSLIACCGAEGIVRILDETTGTLLHTIDAGQGEVNGLASSPDGTTLASAGDDGTIALWDIATGVVKARFRSHQKQAFQVAWSPDGQRLATCGNEQNVRIWSATDFKEICVIPSADRDLECLAVSVNGDLAFGTEGGFVILTKMPGESGQLSAIQTFSDGSSEHCGAVAFSPDGRYLAAGRKDGRVVLRAIAPSVWTQPRELLFHDSVSSLSFSPAGDWLAAGIHDGSVGLVELTDLQHEGYRLTLREGMTDLAGNLLDGDGDGTAGGNLPIEWIDAADRSPSNAPDGVPDEDGRPLRLLRCDPLPANGLLPPGTKTVTLEFSEAVANADNIDLYQFRIADDLNMPTDHGSFHPTDVQVRDAIVTLSVPEVPGHPDVERKPLAGSRHTHTLHKGSTGSAIFSGINDAILSVGEDGCLIRASSQPMRSVAHLKHRYRQRAFAGNGRLLVEYMYSGMADFLSTVNTKENAEEIIQRANTPMLQNSMVAQGTGSVFADIQGQAESGLQREIRKWSPDLRKSETIWKAVRNDYVFRFAVSPDDRFLAVIVFAPPEGARAAGSELLFRDCQLQKEIYRHSLTSHCSMISFSPDGRLLALCFGDRVLLFENSTGKILCSLMINNVRQFAFSPNSQEIATVSEDRTLRIWRLQDGVELHAVLAHGVSANGVAYTPDGKTLATVGTDGLLRFWRRDGMHMTMEIPFENPLVEVIFSPDGLQAAVTDREHETTILTALSPE